MLRHWAVLLPSTFNLNRTLLTSLGVRRPPKHIQKCVSGSDLWFYTSLQSRRPFTTGGTPQNPSTTAAETLSTSQNPKEHRASFRRFIRTLDPARLTPDHYMDIGSRGGPSILVVVQHPESPQPRRFRLFAQAHDWSSGVFPPGTHGFLYYHVSPHSPPLAGELRFRITPSESARFATGSDLLTDAGLPWRYPLWKVVCRDDCRAVAGLLVQDGLVSQETLDAALEAAAMLMRCERAGTVADHGPRKMMAIPVLSRFGQEFEFRFDVGLFRRYLLAGRDSIVRQSFRYIPGFWRRRPVDMRRVNYCPFKGSAVCRFERSALPEHAGRRVVVLRVVRLLDTDPISYVPAPDGEVYEALWPREGELMKIIQYGQVQPWAVDVDDGFQKKRTLRNSLRILFENEELYGSPRKSRRE